MSTRRNCRSDALRNRMMSLVLRYFVQTWDEGDVEIVEALIDYTRHDGKVVTLPCTSILRKRGDLVQDLRIYMDVSPVFA
jgi:hypothetical protein